MRFHTLSILILVACVLPCCAQNIGLRHDGELFRKPEGIVTRWSSFENLSAGKGQGGKENQGAKGYAYDDLAPDESKVLLDVKGSGVVRRMWFTLRPRDPRMLRSLRLEIFWDGAERPAVAVPLSDFFCWTHGLGTAFESALFANPEGRSFVCYIPMPFREGAKVTLTNDSSETLTHLFYDINVTLGDRHADDVMYFHASWRRERPTLLRKDFAILPQVNGSGRFLGCHVGVVADPTNIGWWGEGEAKIYLDGDSTYPTLCGTGTEDYISTAWGQGEFAQRYHGCLLADNKDQKYSYYRYHILDPIYFDKDCRVTIQQIGGSMKKDIVKMLDEKRPILPVSAHGEGDFIQLLDPDKVVDFRRDVTEASWVNYYRQDDYCATAFFYLDSPTNTLAPLPNVKERTFGLGTSEDKP